MDAAARAESDGDEVDAPVDGGGIWFGGVLGQVFLGGLGDAGQFGGGYGFLRGAVGVGAAGADFGENPGGAVLGDEVDFAPGGAVVGGDDAVAPGGQVGAGEGFADASDLLGVDLLGIALPGVDLAGTGLAGVGVPGRRRAGRGAGGIRHGGYRRG